MYIENFKAKQKVREEFLSEPEFELKTESNGDNSRNLNGQMPGGVLHYWQGPEYESYERDKKWYIVMALGLVAIIVYAIFTNSPIMAITFILIGIVEYIYISRDPQMLNFLITEKGIVIEKEIYEFEQIKSFWIFYEPETIKSLSLHIKNNITPYLQIPLHEENPDEIREILSQYVPEIKQEYRLGDSIGRMLRL